MYRPPILSRNTSSPSTNSASTSNTLFRWPTPAERHPSPYSLHCPHASSTRRFSACTAITPFACPHTPRGQTRFCQRRYPYSPATYGYTRQPSFLTANVFPSAHPLLYAPRFFLCTCPSTPRTRLAYGRSCKLRSTSPRSCGRRRRQSAAIRAIPGAAPPMGWRFADRFSQTVGNTVYDV